MKNRLLNKLFSKISFFYSFIPKYTYSLVEVSEQKQFVLLQVRGKTAYIRKTFLEVIGDKYIIYNLSSLEACWIGAHYGRALRASSEKNEVSKKMKQVSYLLKNKPSKYKIVFLDKENNLGYINKKTHDFFLESPLTIAQSKNIITEFDAGQACYIGILAGLLMEKLISFEQKQGGENLKKILSKPAKLRLVK